MTVNTAAPQNCSEQARRARFQTDTERWPGRVVLLLTHVAGMIDLVALPVWVGAALIGQYRFTPERAGVMVTAYLVSAVVASLLCARRFDDVPAHGAVPVGFAIAMAAFIALSGATEWWAMTALHAVAGLGAGVGLSLTHGTIGRSANPQRLFAVVSLGLSASAVLFLGVAQGLIPSRGGATLFRLFAGLMALATLASVVAFPRLAARPPEQHGAAHRVQPLSAAARWVIGGTTLMAVCQSTLFSFVERMGTERGFGTRVWGVLVVLGFVNLVPPLLAGLLEKRLCPLRVAAAGTLAQAVLALTLSFSVTFWPYACAASVFVSVVLFTHPFIFGWLSRHDESGRAVALTPAMLMTGAALGPALGGAVIAAGGTASLGFVALAIDTLALLSFWRATRLSRAETLRNG